MRVRERDNQNTPIVVLFELPSEFILFPILEKLHVGADGTELPCSWHYFCSCTRRSPRSNCWSICFCLDTCLFSSQFFLHPLLHVPRTFWIRVNFPLKKKPFPAVLRTACRCKPCDRHLWSCTASRVNRIGHFTISSWRRRTNDFPEFIPTENLSPSSSHAGRLRSKTPAYSRTNAHESAFRVNLISVSLESKPSVPYPRLE